MYQTISMFSATPPDYSSEVSELIQTFKLPSNLEEMLIDHQQTIQNHYRQLSVMETARSNIVNDNSDRYSQLLLNEKRKKEEIVSCCENLEKHIKDIKKRYWIAPISVICVVLSMTTCEATSLKNSSDTTVNDLFKSLQIYNINDISDYYRDNREEWVPYAHANHFELDPQQDAVNSNKSIRTIISNLVTKFNNESKQPIQLDFATEKFFDPISSVFLWKEIIKQGGIIIVDAVSLLHAGVRDMLLQSGTIGVEKISILAISPINSSNIPTNKILEDFINTNLIHLASDFREPLNRRREIVRGDFRTFNTWFYSILDEKIQPQATVDGRNYMGSLGLREKKGFTSSHFKEY
jgi:hypothetical protein